MAASRWDGSSCNRRPTMPARAVSKRSLRSGEELMLASAACAITGMVTAASLSLNVRRVDLTKVGRRGLRETWWCVRSIRSFESRPPRDGRGREEAVGLVGAGRTWRGRMFEVAVRGSIANRSQLCCSRCGRRRWDCVRHQAPRIDQRIRPGHGGSRCHTDSTVTALSSTAARSPVPLRALSPSPVKRWLSVRRFSRALVRASSTSVENRSPV